MKTKIVISFFLFAAASLFAQTASEPTSFGAWTDLTNTPYQHMGLMARLVVSESANASDSRTSEVYLELQNTEVTGSTMYVYYDIGNYKSTNSLRCELQDGSGKTIPSSWCGYYDGPIQESRWLALPGDSVLRFRCLPIGNGITATNGERLIVAGWNCWHIPDSDTNDYYLSGTLSLSLPKGETRPWTWQGTLKLPPVEIPASSSSGKLN